MNNEQFRRLILDNNNNNPSSTSTKPTPKPRNEKASPNTPANSASVSASTSTTAGALGSRMRSSIPMTPRTLTAPDFARQLSDYRREHGSGQQPPTKKFRSSAAPKGTRLPTGYVDRAAQLRAASSRDSDSVADRHGDGDGDGDGDEEDGSRRGQNDDLEKRIRALEEMVKLGQIDEGTFTKLRSELGVGGDVNSTHMVKGLDWDLLRRVRAGEDVSRSEEKGKKSTEQEEEEEEEVLDVDEELERVLEGIPAASGEKKEKEKKKGNMAPPPTRKTRDEILRELKARRAAVAEAAAQAQPSEPALGVRFKRIGDSAKVEKKRFIEKDENGRRREVLLITDAEGKTKRKVRWLDKPVPADAATRTPGLLVPDKDAKPLGMEVPAEIASKARASIATEPEDEDDDIFAGVGADYDPLADLGEDDGSSESDSGEDGEVKPEESTAETKEKRSASGEPVVAAAAAVNKPRNYFATTDKEVEITTTDDRSNPLTRDPTLMAAFKRAAALRQTSSSVGDDAEGAEQDEGVDRDTLLRRKKFLEEARRQEALDAMDMDLGFGSSRVEDDEDDEDVILEGSRGAKKRKRGPKKKKGNKDSAADVLGVLEGRKNQ